MSGSIPGEARGGCSVLQASFDCLNPPLSNMMSDFEINSLFGVTNQELKCLLLGLIPQDGSRPAYDIMEELMDRGAGKLEANAPTIITKALERLSDTVVTRDNDSLTLNPVGALARATGGHQVRDISRRHAPLVAVYGHKREVQPGQPDQEPLGRLGRVIVLGYLASANDSRIPNTDLNRYMRARGFRASVTLSIVQGLANSGIVTRENDESIGSRGRVYITPKPVVKDLWPDLHALTTRTVTHDEAFKKEGDAKIEAVLDDKTALPYIVRRSVISSNKPRTALYELEEALYHILADHDGSLSTRDLLDHLPSDIRQRYPKDTSFSARIGHIPTLPNSRVVIVATQGNQRKWGIRARNGKLRS